MTGFVLGHHSLRYATCKEKPVSSYFSCFKEVSKCFFSFLLVLNSVVSQKPTDFPDLLAFKTAKKKKKKLCGNDKINLKETRVHINKTQKGETGLAWFPPSLQLHLLLLGVCLLQTMPALH